MDDRPLHLELYSRPGCHLCDDLRVLCERLSSEFPLQLTELNIDTDLGLLARYDQEVPVLFVDGRKAIKYRTTEASLRRLLQRRLLLNRLFGR
jgi:glutaredoxin